MIRPGTLPIAFLIGIIFWLLFLRDPPAEVCSSYRVGPQISHHGAAAYEQCR